MKVVGGIESRDAIRKAWQLCDALNNQAETLDEWREELVKLLLLPLVDQEEGELQGDEYETSTKQQDKVYIYVEAIRALVADRRDALTGEVNILVRDEMNRSLGLANKGEGHAPELALQMLTKRLELKPKEELRSIRGIIAELGAIKTTLKGQEERGNSRTKAELQVVNTALGQLQLERTKHTKVVVELEGESSLYRDSMNARLEYYRQLQMISDTVRPLEEELTDRRLRSMQISDAATEEKIAELKSRGRYLRHLRDGSAQDVERKCLICQEENFEIGTLTSCGHAFCKECLNLWTKSHQNCPACKKGLRTKDLHQITYKPSELRKSSDKGSPTSSTHSLPLISGFPVKSKATIYTNMSAQTLAAIQDIDVKGSFGTKIDTLTRHLLWLRQSDPGAKSILFSQFRDFLDMLERALSKAGIRCTSIDRPRGIETFKHDPAVECFLLPARAHASGLNLVHATHVFLCEPLVNAALELQAIARVHRIGQHHETTVWMYLIQGTVEQAVYERSVARRLAHMPGNAEGKGKATKGTRKGGKKDLEDDIEKANSLQMQEAPLARLLASGKGGGEVVRKDDLWACLFSASGAKAVGQDRLVGSGSGDEADRVGAGFLAAQAAEQRQLVRR